MKHIPLHLKSFNAQSGKPLADITLKNLDIGLLKGNVALVSHPGTGDRTARFWFRNWHLSGDKFALFEERNCGPLLSCQYTLSKKTLKLTAQLMPIGENDNYDVMLQVSHEGEWIDIASTKIIEPAFTATFKMENWNDTLNVAYRIKYKLINKDNSSEDYYRYGTIRKDPVEKEKIIVAAFTGNHNVVRPDPKRWGGVDVGKFPWDWGLWFPHLDLTVNVKKHDPDLLFFSGDQVYEGASPTGVDGDNLKLDYLYKWYLWCWAFRDLTKNIPTVTIPDDHDVYHGNIWGDGGKATPEGLYGAKAQDAGGYKMTPEFVNMVQQTQTSHLPDPFDSTSVEQNIGVYYCDLSYGGISFAVLEDRKFKSAPKPLLPNAQIWNGWYQNKDFNPKTESDIPGAKLLGDRQIKFLKNWTVDWSYNTWMKVVLSQTLFANVATLPKGSLSGSIIPSLPILGMGEYAENDYPVSDMDSNGWPQSGRTKAVKVLRKSFAFHIAGDQHLGSTIQYGTDNWGDAGYALCVPSIANFWPRRWYPKEPGKNNITQYPRYSGDFEDGFGNKMTVFAVSNPSKYGKEPTIRHNLAPGYGIVKFYRSSRDIEIENWPIWADPSRGDKPYNGWPIIINQTDNYGKEAVAFLPIIEVSGIDYPVIQVISEKDNEIIYTIRLKDKTFHPKVFEHGQYTVLVADPDLNKSRRIEHIKSVDIRSTELIKVAF